MDSCNTTTHLNRTNGAIDLAISIYIRDSAEPFYYAAHNYHSIGELYASALLFRDAVRYSHWDRSADFHVVNSTVVKIQKRAVVADERDVKITKRTAKSTSFCSSVIIPQYCTDSSDCGQKKCNAFFSFLDTAHRFCFLPQVNKLIRDRLSFSNDTPDQSIQANDINAMCSS